ncbi:MAG: endonuclease MutS2 [Clostridioides sp.]|jgi:DNA mismatch repair protein MutS2|nr:endonuclease MutS2 [Clostridioides sp.]
MNKKSMRVLEFQKIKEILKSFASSKLGISFIEKLEPSSNIDIVNQTLEETNEAESILIKKGSVGLSGISDVEDKVKRAEIGASLDAGSLLNIAKNLQVARNIKRILASNAQEDFVYPIIQGMSESLFIFRELEDKILSSIISEIEISDNASPILKNLRRSIIQKNQSIRSKLNQIITSSTYQKYLQDAIVSIRDDRFVVPVKAEYKSYVSGIVHDQSSSGATFFIEPMSIVNMNNELRELRLKEKEEIERILQELSSEVGDCGRGIIQNQTILSQLDFIFAKGKLSISMRGIKPEINNEKKIYLKNARHPLIGKKEVISNTIYLGDGFNTLVITGPNTGGKTVTIKTVGLLALMTQSGLNIPADFGSKMCIFDNIFADIGDEQSIEQSLSTFSSHMTNIVSILDEVTQDSLVIFDELGAGTDPVEGAALAISILEFVKGVGANCVATTHYSELKNYAITNDGVENAAVEFDIDTLSPTYKLLIGVPGKSNAFEISRKLGLGDYIISKAKEHITTDNIMLEDVLQNAEISRLKAEEERLEAKRLRLEIEEEKKRYNEKLEKLEKKKEKSLERARKEAFSILRDAKEEADRIIKELKELEKQRRYKVSDGREEELRKELRDSIGKLQPSVESMIVPKVSNQIIKDLKPGESVRIVSLNQDGSVLSVDNAKKEAVVQIGIMRMTLPFKSLTRNKKSEKNIVTKSTRNIIKSKSGKVKSEVDLRGMNLEEATMAVEKYLDDACISGLEKVTVIHGIGTGVLKKGLQDVIKRNRNVKSQRPGVYGEGGIGVTIVEFK